MGFVPALKLEMFKNEVFSESMPILELLEEVFPSRPLLPTSPVEPRVV